jgi:hypothetical protein
MGLFGKLLKTTFDVVTTPIDLMKDVATLGGTLTEEESALVKKAKRLNRDAEEIRNELDDL